MNHAIDVRLDVRGVDLHHSITAGGERKPACMVARGRFVLIRG
jgi:hypothetical protein